MNVLDVLICTKTNKMKLEPSPGYTKWHWTKVLETCKSLDGGHLEEKRRKL